MILSRVIIRSLLITKSRQWKQTESNSKQFADSLLAVYGDSQNLSPPVYYQLSGQSYHQSYLFIVICLIFSESADVFIFGCQDSGLGLSPPLTAPWLPFSIHPSHAKSPSKICSTSHFFHFLSRSCYIGLLYTWKLDSSSFWFWCFISIFSFRTENQFYIFLMEAHHFTSTIYKSSSFKLRSGS